MDDKKKDKKEGGKLTKKETELEISQLQKEMIKASKALNFEEAATLRDEILELKATLSK